MNGRLKRGETNVNHSLERALERAHDRLLGLARVLDPFGRIAELVGRALLEADDAAVAVRAEASDQLVGQLQLLARAHRLILFDVQQVGERVVLARSAVNEEGALVVQLVGGADVEGTGRLDAAPRVHGGRLQVQTSQHEPPRPHAVREGGQRVQKGRLAHEAQAFEVVGGEASGRKGGILFDQSRGVETENAGKKRIEGGRRRKGRAHRFSL